MTDLKKVCCCKALWSSVDKGEMKYNLVLKHFGCYIKTKDNDGKDSYLEIQTMRYCPFCGAKLPDYSDKYDDELEKAVGKEYCDIKPEDIPEEFKSDKWWKKRGL